MPAVQCLLDLFGKQAALAERQHGHAVELVVGGSLGVVGTELLSQHA
jgi:hypothetical protein